MERKSIVCSMILWFWSCSHDFKSSTCSSPAPDVCALCSAYSPMVVVVGGWPMCCSLFVSVVTAGLRFRVAMLLLLSRGPLLQFLCRSRLWCGITFRDVSICFVRRGGMELARLCCLFFIIHFVLFFFFFFWGNFYLCNQTMTIQGVSAPRAPGCDARSKMLSPGPARLKAEIGDLGLNFQLR